MNHLLDQAPDFRLMLLCKEAKVYSFISTSSSVRRPIQLTSALKHFIQSTRLSGFGDIANTVFRCFWTHMRKWKQPLSGSEELQTQTDLW